MAESQETAGEPRRSDRRGTERRSTERRTPVPAWRSPMALVAYGVVGALLVVGIMKLATPDAKRVENAIVDAPVRPSVVAKPASGAGTGQAEIAYTTGDYERLIIEGQGAIGKRVRAELFCAAPTQMTVRAGQSAEPSLAALVDAEGKVSGAECKWGGHNDRRREEFVLLVPPALAGKFSSAPVVTDDFVQRRHLVADLEWVGRSEALALRTAGVLRGVAPPT